MFRYDIEEMDSLLQRPVVRLLPSHQTGTFGESLDLHAPAELLDWQELGEVIGSSGLGNADMQIDKCTIFNH